LADFIKYPTGWATLLPARECDPSRCPQSIRQALRFPRDANTGRGNSVRDFVPTRFTVSRMETALARWQMSVIESGHHEMAVKVDDLECWPPSASGCRFLSHLLNAIAADGMASTR